MNEQPKVKLGFIGLASLVFGMMVGGGIFNIPQNMAADAGPAAIILSWLVTAAGMLLLVYTFKTLADIRPDLSCGIYEYARRGFGSFAGFMSAWGYWLSAAFANVAYIVMLNDSFGTFFPELLDHGRPTIIFGTVLIWTIYLIVVNGMKTAKALTIIFAIIKFSAIGLMLLLMALNFRAGTFSPEFWGSLSDFCGLGEQVRSTMLVTLWCFIGIEGAAVMSGRAKRLRDVGRASVTGFFAAWILYLLASLLCFGCMTRAELAGLNNPSAAYVLRAICGDWGFYFVIISIIIALLGGLVAWTLICAEVPSTAASRGLLPRSYMHLNRHDMPAQGLFISSVIMQMFLMLVATADNVYLTALNITGMMILPCYLLSGAFLCKIAHGAQRLLGLCCAIFCIWMIYAGGIDLFMQTSIFYLAGFMLYLRARAEQGLMMLTPRIALAIVLLLAIAVYSFLM